MQFTRYLYIKDEVQYSILISLLRCSSPEYRNPDEVFFWAYELYFSGWEAETFEYLFRIYADFYELRNPTLKNTLQKRYTLWKKDNDPYHLGTILHNLMRKPYNATVFLQKYIPAAVRPRPNDTIQKRQNHIIVFQERELYPYLTVEPDGDESTLGKAWQVLRNECRYTPYRTSHKQSVFVFHRVDALYRFREQWLYYAAYSTPIWKTRIERFQGVLNAPKKRVDFPTEEIEEAFYQQYGYEPDEQPTEIQQRCVGSTPTKHGELALLQIPYIIDFSGNLHHFSFNMNGLDSCLCASSMRKGVIREDEITEETVLPPPPPAIDYFT